MFLPFPDLSVGAVVVLVPAGYLDPGGQPVGVPAVSCSVLSFCDLAHDGAGAVPYAVLVSVERSRRSGSRGGRRGCRCTATRRAGHPAIAAMAWALVVRCVVMYLLSGNGVPVRTAKRVNRWPVIG